MRLRRHREDPWRVLRLPQWTPLTAAFAGEPVHLVRGLYRCGGLYLLTRAVDDEDRDVPPQVGGVLWALDDEVATCVYDTAPLPDDVAERRRPPAPPPDVPLDAATARRSATMLTTSCAFADGAFSHSSLWLQPGTKVHFAAPEPADGDLAVAVTVQLETPAS